MATFPGPAVATSATGKLLAEGPPGKDGVQGLTGPRGAPGQDGTAIKDVVTIIAAGTFPVEAGTWYFVNLGLAAGNVVLTTTSLGPKDSFYVKLIDPTGLGTGGHTVTIQPIVAGQHIESISAPGTLDASSVSYVMSVVGQEVELTSNDGTNLWY